MGSETDRLSARLQLAGLCCPRIVDLAIKSRDVGNPETVETAARACLQWADHLIAADAKSAPCSDASEMARTIVRLEFVNRTAIDALKAISALCGKPIPHEPQSDGWKIKRQADQALQIAQDVEASK